MIMSYSSGNPNFDRMVAVENAVLDAYKALDPFKHVAKVPVGAGVQVVHKKFAQMPTIPAATKHSVMSWMEKFSSRPGDYRVPRHRLAIKMDEDEYRSIMAGGEYEGFATNAAKSLAASVAKTFFQNVLDVTATSDYPYWGMIDESTANGTFDRPLLPGATTKVTGAWTTASIGANTAAALKGRIITVPEFNDGTPLVMVYPNVIEEVLESQNPGILAMSRIKDEFLTRFGVIEPAGETDEMGTTYAKSLLSGNEELPADFDIVGYNPNWFIGVYEHAPSATLELVGHQQGAILTLIHNIGLMPIPLKRPNGKTYKACQIIKASGS
jgi:hypothetical protein